MVVWRPGVPRPKTTCFSEMTLAAFGGNANKLACSMTCVAVRPWYPRLPKHNLAKKQLRDPLAPEPGRNRPKSPLFLEPDPPRAFRGPHRTSTSLVSRRNSRRRQVNKRRSRVKLDWVSNPGNSVDSQCLKLGPAVGRNPAISGERRVRNVGGSRR